jgi:UDP-2,3-diacylglucosamine pyrophosphatase LpxH
MRHRAQSTFSAFTLLVGIHCMIGAAVAQQIPGQAPLVAARGVPAVVVVISDLHMGAGEKAIGQYYAQEDFRWGEDFVTFLDAIYRAGGGKTWLVIAGDMFELWENAAGDPCDAEQNLGCTEDEALARMVRIVSAHRVELQALGAFASRGPSNRVIIVPGNHDAALLYPRVRDLVKAAARPTRPDRFEFMTTGRWISPGEKIVVEHGHQFDPANRFDHWPTPMLLAPSGATRLESPFGEELVRQFFDPIEQKYEAVDNIGDSGLLYGVKAAGFVGSTKAVTDFVKLLTLDASPRQFSEFLSSDTEHLPKWDLATVRAAPLDFLLNGIPADDPEGMLVRETLSPPTPEITAAATATVDSMTDEELQAICWSRYVMNLQQEKASIAEPLRQQRCANLPGGDLGYLKNKAITSVRGSLYYVHQYIESVVSQLPSIRSSDTPVTFVYGHTHTAMRAEPSRNARFTIVNDGAWQRLISGNSMAELAKKNGWAAGDVLKKVRLADLPACYSFVWIPFSLGAKALDPKLRYWMLDGDNWKFATSCPDREKLPAE